MKNKNDVKSTIKRQKTKIISKLSLLVATGTFMAITGYNSQIPRVKTVLPPNNNVSDIILENDKITIIIDNPWIEDDDSYLKLIDHYIVDYETYLLLYTAYENGNYVKFMQLLENIEKTIFKFTPESDSYKDKDITLANVTNIQMYGSYNSEIIETYADFKVTVNQDIELAAIITLLFTVGIYPIASKSITKDIKYIKQLKKTK